MTDENNESDNASEEEKPETQVVEDQQADESEAQDAKEQSDADAGAQDIQDQQAGKSETQDDEEQATEKESSLTSPPLKEKSDTAHDIAKSISAKDVNIDTLLKVPVSLAIEVGRTQMTLSDLIETQEGSVIELDRLLDEPLDILVNGALIAHGVVVLANEKFGLQITDIISLEDRARSL
ncbi:MAG: flagellar motor switch protein FliN [SAR86 cluster bacterium]|uniref:Flagellar motor switch protein FliN n=1 Tax=SAR86 cluster bacterium TaxID=2030880 RepID=A0A2A5B5L2_9GAMM|nr:MAG: flagellar motor switch protein FliN [SAR86 cluster bacterium]